LSRAITRQQEERADFMFHWGAHAAIAHHEQYIFAVDHEIDRCEPGIDVTLYGAKCRSPVKVREVRSRKCDSNRERSLLVGYAGLDR
jgi:hypothetical protein